MSFIEMLPFLELKVDTLSVQDVSGKYVKKYIEQKAESTLYMLQQTCNM